MLSFWVVDDHKEYLGIMAASLKEAEDTFWQGVLKDEYPFDAYLIEMILDPEECEQIMDTDIISIE